MAGERLIYELVASIQRLFSRYFVFYFTRTCGDSYFSEFVLASVGPTAAAHPRLCGPGNSPQQYWQPVIDSMFSLVLACSLWRKADHEEVPGSIELPPSHSLCCPEVNFVLVEAA